MVYYEITNYNWGREYTSDIKEHPTGLPSRYGTTAYVFECHSSEDLGCTPIKSKKKMYYQDMEETVELALQHFNYTYLKHGKTEKKPKKVERKVDKSDNKKKSKKKGGK